MDRRLLDLWFVVRGARAALAPVVIVGIDYESLQRVGHRWPWPRSIHGRLVERLASAGASVVAFDVLFTEADPSSDGALALAAEAAGNVVWASTFDLAAQRGFDIRRHSGPTPALQVPSSVSGYVNLPFDPDGSVRRVQPFLHFGPRVLKSFAVVVADRHRREPLLHLSAAGARWPGPGGRAVRVEPDGSLLINFAGPPGSFPVVPYIRVLEGNVPPATFAGKIVLVGAAGGDADRFFTPFYSRLLPETSRPMDGVEIYANIIHMLLGGRFLARLEPAWALLAFLALGLAAGFSMSRHAWLTAGALLGAVAAALALAYVLFAAVDVWLPVAGMTVAAPVLWGALAFRGFVAERQEKEFVRSALERYVSPAVVEDLIARRIDPALGGTRRTVTVLFSDIRGFTGLSERIPPETLVQVLNRHFTAAAEIVFRHQGTLDKFVGDAVMAFWGAPVPQEDHALRAVRAALEMQTAARALDAELAEQLGAPLRIGIGINTGQAIVGHLGSPRRLGYTAVGDPVNLAARVEAMTREREADILVTQFTWELVKFHVEGEPLGILPVRGRQEPVAVYRVLGLRVS
jgi:adenylate cyclase